MRKANENKQRIETTQRILHSLRFSYAKIYYVNKKRHYTIATTPENITQRSDVININRNDNTINELSSSLHHISLIEVIKWQPVDICISVFDSSSHQIDICLNTSFKRIYINGTYFQINGNEPIFKFLSNLKDKGNGFPNIWEIIFRSR